MRDFSLVLMVLFFVVSAVPIFAIDPIDVTTNSFPLQTSEEMSCVVSLNQDMGDPQTCGNDATLNVNGVNYGKAHTCSLPNLEDGSNAVYVVCTDGAGNVNDNPYVITVNYDSSIVYYSFDNDVGNVVTDEIGNYNGQLNGNPTIVENGCVSGKCYFLDGAKDYIDIPGIVSPVTAYTYSFWFKPSVNLGGGSGRMDFWYYKGAGRPHITFDRDIDVNGNDPSNGRIGLYVSDPTTGYDDVRTTTASWSKDVWHYVVFTFDGTDYKAYVNGEEEGVFNHPGDNPADTGAFIGTNSPTGDFYNGLIDDVKVYGTALKPERVKEEVQCDGEINSLCLCGGEFKTTGYCCSDQYRQTSCQEICGDPGDNNGDGIISLYDNQCPDSIPVNVAGISFTPSLVGGNSFYHTTEIEGSCSYAVGSGTDLKNASYCVEVSGGDALRVNRGDGFVNFSLPLTDLLSTNSEITCSVSQKCNNGFPNTLIGHYNVTQPDLCSDGEKGSELEITNLELNDDTYQKNEMIDITVTLKSTHRDFVQKDLPVGVEAQLYDLTEDILLASSTSSGTLGYKNLDSLTFNLTVPKKNIFSGSVHRLYIKAFGDSLTVTESDLCVIDSLPVTLSEASGAASCVDSDGDGDCDETDCAVDNALISHLATEICDDNLDNDCDGFIDDADTECIPTSCVENWQCEDYSPTSCSSGEIQTRACNDLRSCGTFVNKPSTSRSCPGDVDTGDDDSDNDRLPDWWELQYFNTLEFNGEDDFDRDGSTNYQEYINGTNPKISDEEKGGVGFWIVIIIIAVIAIGGAIFYLVSKGGKTPKIGDLQRVKGGMKFKQTGVDPRITKYVSQCRTKKIPDTTIKKTLLRSGWKEHAVDAALRK